MAGFSEKLKRIFAKDQKEASFTVYSHFKDKKSHPKTRKSDDLKDNYMFVLITLHPIDATCFLFAMLPVSKPQPSTVCGNWTE